MAKLDFEKTIIYMIDRIDNVERVRVLGYLMEKIMSEIDIPNKEAQFAPIFEKMEELKKFGNTG